MQEGYEVYAFIPKGRDFSPVPGDLGFRTLVRIGRHKFRKKVRFESRFEGLNKPKHLLVHVEVESKKKAELVVQMLEEILKGVRTYGPCVFEGEMRFDGTLRPATDMGRNWYWSIVSANTMRMTFKPVQKWIAKNTVHFRPPGMGASTLYPLPGDRM